MNVSLTVSRISDFYRDLFSFMAVFFLLFFFSWVIQLKANAKTLVLLKWLISKQVLLWEAWRSSPQASDDLWYFNSVFRFVLHRPSLLHFKDRCVLYTNIFVNICFTSRVVTLSFYLIWGVKTCGDEAVHLSPTLNLEPELDWRPRGLHTTYTTFLFLSFSIIMSWIY